MAINKKDKNYIKNHAWHFKVKDLVDHFNGKYPSRQIMTFLDNNKIDYIRKGKPIDEEDKMFIRDNYKDFSIEDFYSHFNGKYEKKKIQNFCHGQKFKYKLIKKYNDFILSSEDKEFIFGNEGKYTIREFVKLFDSKYTIKQVKTYCSDNKIGYKKLKSEESRKINEEDLNFIKNNNNLTINEIFDYFNKKYTKSQIRGTIQNNRFSYKRVFSEGIFEEDKKYILENCKEKTIREFCLFFKNKYSIKQIRSYLNKNKITYKRCVKDLTKFSEEDIKHLKDNIDKNLFEFYNYFEKKYTRSQISHFCSYYNIEYRKMTNQEKKDSFTYRKRVIDIDQDYFKKWTENSMYTLGFWTSDGNVNLTNNKKYIQIGVKQEDSYILESFLKEFNSGGHKIKTGKNNFRAIGIGSKVMFDDLCKLKCVERKSLTLELCSDISDELFPHYLRGHFDGDGTIGYDKASDYYKFSICSASERFIIDIFKKIKCIDGNLRGCFSKTLMQNSKNYIYSIAFSKYDSMRIAIIMYKNADLRLSRKFERFCKVFETPVKTKRKKEIELELQLKEIWKNEILPSLKS